MNCPCTCYIPEWITYTTLTLLIAAVLFAIWHVTKRPRDYETLDEVRQAVRTEEKKELLKMHREAKRKYGNEWDYKIAIN